MNTKSHLVESVFKLEKYELKRIRSFLYFYLYSGMNYLALFIDLQINMNYLVLEKLYINEIIAKLERKI